MAKVRSTEDIRLFWNTFADSYEKNFNTSTILLNSMLVPLLSLSPDHTVAECGFGTGSGIEIILNHCPNINKILANDISDAMLLKAQMKNLKNTELVLAPNENLPYESSSCDRYISNLSIHIVENPKKMLEEAFRVMKPGAIGIISTIDIPKEFSFVNTNKQCLIAAGAEFPNDRSMFHLSEKGHLNQMASEVGFVNVRSFSTSIPLLAKNIEELLSMAHESPECFAIKAKDQEMFERYLAISRTEFSRIWNEGHALTLDFLVMIFER